MPYKNLINISCSTPAEVFRHVTDFLTARSGIADYSATGIGWTLHDSQFAASQDAPVEGDWVVIRSSGENGRQALYYRIVLATLGNGILRTSSGLSWLASTNTWTSPYPPGGDQASGPTSGTALSVYLYGDLDSISIIIGNGTSRHGRFYGLLDSPMHSQDVALATAAVASGSNVVVPLDAIPPSWKVGGGVIIRDQANIKKAVVVAIAGNSITLASLTVGFSVGAMVSGYYATMCSNGDYFLTQGYGQVAQQGTIGCLLNAATDTYLITNADPDQMNGCYAAIRIAFCESTYGGYFGHAKNVLRISPVGITSGNVYADYHTGDTWRALTFVSGQALLFREV